uniref:Actin-like protein n=1 Tax=Siphoviridae sp. ctEkS11 TaxID=2827272 RepID=A0A8S5R3J9_9CAUD|nr:MAG TPA: actin-like protein [Siphoviridae sp. ctEkS11]
MPKPIFWMHTELRCVSSTLTTALYSYNQFGD